jgi:hypothetical protein
MLEALPIKRGAVVEVLRFLLFVVVTLGSLVASLVIGAWLLVLFMLSSAIGMAMLARLDSLEALKGAFGEFSFAGLYASLHGVDGTIIRFLGLYIGVACVVISAGALLLWLALSLVASLFNLAFGKLFVVATLFLDISVEASPLGRYESHHVMPNIEGGPRFFSLRHSQSHSTPAAIAVIAEWIRRR